MSLSQTQRVLGVSIDMRAVTHNLPVSALILLFLVAGPFAESAWKRHTIDDAYSGADGVRLGDANRDGHLDIATGWEEEGVVRLYLNPGPERFETQWPAVTVGQVDHVEDAVFCDLDGDGALDIVSSCEGKTKSMFVHWAPLDSRELLDETKWETALIPASKGVSKWMFALPADIDGVNGIDLFAGSKDPQGQVSWLRSPPNPRTLEEWTLHPLVPANWVMSLRQVDINEDGRKDLIYVDRKGPEAGVFALLRPESADSLHQAWSQQRISTALGEYMFLDLDKDQSSLQIYVPAKGDGIYWFQQDSNNLDSWEETLIQFALRQGVGREKAIAAGDINLDGDTDLVWTGEGSDSPKSGVVWLERRADKWLAHDISGPAGIKFDRIELLDLDHDGDLDVLTCEEREGGSGLGVMWYENPHR